LTPKTVFPLIFKDNFENTRYEKRRKTFYIATKNPSNHTLKKENKKPNLIMIIFK